MKNKLFSSKVKWILMIALIAAIAIAVISTMAGGSALSNAVQTVLTPVRSAAAAVTRTVERRYEYAYAYEKLEAENKVLQEKISDMEEVIRSADTLERENERLRNLLSLSEEHEDYQYVSSYIIGKDSSNWKSTFTIDKGSFAGLSEGMCAITEYGQVIGLITEVGSNWATVTTVLDSSLEISASVSSSGYSGVVEGTYRAGDTGSLRLNYLSTDAVMKNGDQVISTGSTLYPKGLIIGYVTDVGLDETGIAKYALLDAAVDFQNLEQVFVISDYNNG